MIVEFLTLLLYLVTFSVVLTYSIKINYFQLGLEDGVYIGMIYFIVVPLIIAIFQGEINDYYLMAEPFYPLQETTTAIQICLGCFVIMMHHVLAARLIKTKVQIKNTQFESCKLIHALCILYFAISLYVFFSSGKSAGGHWQENLAEAFQSSTSLIIMGNFANVYRGAIFAVLYNFYNKRIVSRKYTLSLGIIVVTFDLLTTFNRITAAYFVIMVVLMYRKHMGKIILLAIPFFPLVAYISFIWANVRAIALTDGYSLSGFMDAIATVNNAIAIGKMEVGDSVGGLFESTNIVVFDWLVKNTGEQFPTLYGFTFFIRPLTVFIPSTFWPSKPGIFSTYVGYHLQGIEGLALNATLFGEAFGNFEYLWPIPLLCTLIGLSYVYNAVSKRLPFVATAAFFSGFALWRFDMSFAVITLVALSGFAIPYMFFVRKLTLQK